ncbi:hypothetical protein B0H16DRAFT_1743855 [Mycena metata]|uniref:Uncharacterized protein n=1 Tax=Mycena metata TaxID=1033252 RepID=A0AAD7MDX2_9AGAR|nr:hypothetical protein B0H16DRAFT_1743855 [Mycena metata]
MLRRFSAHARFHATTLSPSPMPMPLMSSSFSCGCLFYRSLSRLSISTSRSSSYTLHRYATFLLLTLRRYDNCWQRLRVAAEAVEQTLLDAPTSNRPYLCDNHRRSPASISHRIPSSFTAGLSAGPRSSWHCIPHLRAAFLKRTVDLNVGRAKLGTFTAAYMRALTFIHPGRSYARRRGYSWRAAADDPTSRGHDGADGGRIEEHWLANVVEVMELYFPSFQLNLYAKI